MKNAQNHKIPLVLGITGHRDILDKHISNLEKKLEEIFDNLLTKYPDTPIILLTPLADGADRIISNVALQEKYKDKITISVPLPMDEKSYKDTFAKGISPHKDEETSDEEKAQLEETSKTEFDDIMKKVFLQENEYIPKTIPMLFNKSIYDELKYIEKNKNEDKIDKYYYKENFSNYVKLADTFEKFENDLEKENKRKRKKNEKEHTKSTFLMQQIRREQYSIVGEYISIHSHILIALYDECEKELPGGTKEIVRKKLTGAYEHFKVKDVDVTYPEDGIVYAIDTPKGDKDLPDNYTIKKLFPNGKEIEELNKEVKYEKNILISLKNKVLDKFSNPCISSNIKNLNIYSKHHRTIECFNKEVVQNISKIENDTKNDLKKVKCCNDKLIHKNIMLRRSAAFLSRLYQKKMEGIEKTILVLIAITIFILMIQSNFPKFEYSSYIDPIYLILVGLFFITYLKFKGYKEKYEDYRGLSESLRVQTAWNMAHINDSIAFYYLSHQKNELDWIRTAIRGINIFYTPKEDTEFKKEQVNKYWLDEQIDYFTNNIKKDKDKELNISKKIKYNFIIFLFFTAVFSILSFTTEINQCKTEVLGFTLFDFLKLILVGIPFTIASYLKSKQYFDGNSDKLKEYELSKDIFNRAKKLLSEDNGKNQKVYKNLGIEALRENSSWLISRRTKDYELV